MKTLVTLLFVLGISIALFSQEDIPIDNSLGQDSETKVDKVFPTIIVYNLPTSTVLRKGELKLYLAHRMGKVGTGIDGFFGLYQANSRIGFDLGMNKFITLGLGTTSQQKFFDGYAKVQLTKQSLQFPFETALYTSIIYSNIKYNVPEDQQHLWQQISYYNQFMISRLINKKIGVQLNLAHVHRNMVKTKIDKNDILSVGGTFNVKLNRMFYFATEYMYLPSNMIGSQDINSHIISTGIQIHTGPRHVFQIFLSNSVGILPSTVITETNSSFLPKNLRISFNIPTTFQLFNK